ncbi:Uncharacterized protein APZ42_007815, partial [Daphnia magna]
RYEKPSENTGTNSKQQTTSSHKLLFNSGHFYSLSCLSERNPCNSRRNLLFLKGVVLKRNILNSREREDRERKKRRLAEELDHCIRLQNQWKAIQKFIEMEEDRLIEECQLQRSRLSQMQQQERKEKAEKLASIRHRLQKALEVEEV